VPFSLRAQVSRRSVRRGRASALSAGAGSDCCHHRSCRCGCRGIW